MASLARQGLRAADPLDAGEDADWAETGSGAEAATWGPRCQASQYGRPEVLSHVASPGLDRSSFICKLAMVVLTTC